MDCKLPERAATLAQVLAGALDEGLISDEKYFLGTCSLDHSDRAWDTREFPRTTLPMLALCGRWPARMQ